MMNRSSHLLEKDAFVMQGEVSYGVPQELHNYCDDHTTELP